MIRLAVYPEILSACHNIIAHLLILVQCHLCQRYIHDTPKTQGRPSLNANDAVDAQALLNISEYGSLTSARLLIIGRHMLEARCREDPFTDWRTSAEAVTPSRVLTS